MALMTALGRSVPRGAACTTCTQLAGSRGGNAVFPEPDRVLIVFRGSCPPTYQLNLLLCSRWLSPFPPLSLLCLQQLGLGMGPSGMKSTSFSTQEPDKIWSFLYVVNLQKLLNVVGSGEEEFHPSSCRLHVYYVLKGCRSSLTTSSAREGLSKHRVDGKWGRGGA